MSEVEQTVLETVQDGQKVRLQVVSEQTPQTASRQRRKGSGQKRRANGTLSEVRPGVWKLRRTVGYRETGSPVQESRLFRGTKRDAERALATYVTEVGAPRRGEGKASRTLEHYLAEWIEHWAHPDQGNSPTTAQVYRRTIKNYLVPHLGDLRLDQVGPDDIDKMTSSVRSRNLSAGTQHRILTVLSSALTQAVKWRLIPTNPCREANKPTQRTVMPPIPTPEEVKAIIALAYKRGDEQIGDAFSLIAATGMRRSEACALRFSDFDASRGVVTIARAMQELTGRGRVETRPKTARSCRTISLNAACIDIIVRRQIGTQPTDFILGTGQTPLAPVRVTQVYNRLAKKLGIKATRVHSLRHFNATQLLTRGFALSDVAARLGDDPRTVLANYAGIVKGQDQKLADLMGDILGGAKDCS